MSEHEKPAMHGVERTWSPYHRLPAAARTRLRRLWNESASNPDTASLVRYEIDMLLLRVRCAVSIRHRRAKRSLADRRGLRVHLGCGNALKAGWINVDCYPPPQRADCETLIVDMRRELPFADGSALGIYSEHFFEHVPLEIVRERLLPECMRILEPGGFIRVGVPDGEFYLKAYFARTDPRYARHLNGRPPMMWINHVARSSLHQYLYDYETLQHLFAEAGFTDLRRGRANDSQNPLFGQIDMDDELRREITVYIEGRRPLHHAFEGRNGR